MLNKYDLHKEACVPHY